MQVRITPAIRSVETEISPPYLHASPLHLPHISPTSPQVLIASAISSVDGVSDVSKAEHISPHISLISPQA